MSFFPSYVNQSTNLAFSLCKKTSFNSIFPIWSAIITPIARGSAIRTPIPNGCKFLPSQYASAAGVIFFVEFSKSLRYLATASVSNVAVPSASFSPFGLANIAIKPEKSDTVVNSLLSIAFISPLTDGYVANSLPFFEEYFH